tara:strand:- start:199 stop:609 length:411 start_codon:yes stop_codon:yes gene_type:complete
MKKYKTNLQFLFSYFRETSYLKKIKILFKITGIKYIIYHTLSFFLLIVLKAKSFFIRGLIFDLQKKLRNLFRLKRNGTWDQMFKLLEKFDYIVDLSCENLKAEKINTETLKNLGSGWQNEEKDKHSLFTDLILLHK